MTYRFLFPFRVPSKKRPFVGRLVGHGVVEDVPHIHHSLKVARAEGDQYILTMTNVTDRESSIEIPLSDLGLKEILWRDLISEKEWKVERDQLSITMQPYDVIWLMPVRE